MIVLLWIVGVVALVAGAGVALTGRPLPWQAGRSVRPRLWGAGFALFGLYALGMALLWHAGPHRMFLALILVPALGLMVAGSRARRV